MRECKANFNVLRRNQLGSARPTLMYWLGFKLGVVYMKNKILIIIILIILTINNFAFGAEIYKDKTKAYLLADYKTGEILESNNIDTPIQIASISKLLSYFVIMDEITKGNISYQDKIIVDNDTTSVKGSSYKLICGEEFSVEKLLKASIIVSGNDAIYALAKHIAGTEQEFVKLMKNKARELGLSRAELYNSSGLPINTEGLQNKMTTREIFIMTKAILDNYPEVLEISKTPFISEPSRGFLEMNTNPLLRTIEGIDGLKTGFTGKAGYCYVSTINIKGEPKVTEDLRLIAIVMGAKSYDERTLASKALIQHGMDNYERSIILDKETSIDTLTFPKGDPERLAIYPEEDFSMLVNKNSRIKLDININKNNDQIPILKGSALGTVTVILDNDQIYTMNVLSKQDVKKSSALTLGLRFYQGLFNKAESIFMN